MKVAFKLLNNRWLTTWQVYARPPASTAWSVYDWRQNYSSTRRIFTTAAAQFFDGDCDKADFNFSSLYHGPLTLWGLLGKGSNLYYFSP